MGASQSQPAFVPPVRYSIYNESIDTACAIEDGLAKLAGVRRVAMVTGIIATLFVGLSLFIPCWVTNVKSGENIGVLYYCVHNKCQPFVDNRTLEDGDNSRSGFRGAIAAVAFLSLLIIAADVLSLILHLAQRTLTDKVLVAWNIASFLYLITGILLLVFSIFMTFAWLPNANYKPGAAFGLSFYSAWLAVVLCLVSGSTHFYLSHKLGWIIHDTGSSTIRDFTAEASEQYTRS